MVFEQPVCPASYPANAHVALEPVHNDVLVYIAVAVATFAAVPSLLWFRDRRNGAGERRPNGSRVVSSENIKATGELSGIQGSPAISPATPTPEPGTTRETGNAEMVKDSKKKRTKDRRKRNREQSRPDGRGRKTAPAPSPTEPSSRAPDSTPRAPDQPTFAMPDIASPVPMSIIPPSFHSSSSSPSPSHSRSASVSSTTAPLTPSSLPHSHSHSLPLALMNSADPWALHLPPDDPAWDWDGQSSTYSSGSRAPSCFRPPQNQSQLQSHPQSLSSPNLSSPKSSSSPSPTSPSLSPAPLVFPSLNMQPPPDASLATQIASLKGALEASRMREDIHRRDAERWSKECDIIKWKWNEASEEWRRRETEFQTQIHHLLQQHQTLMHTLQLHATSPVSPLSFPFGTPSTSGVAGPHASPHPSGVPGQHQHPLPFPLASPFASLHHPLSPFLNGGANNLVGSMSGVVGGITSIGNGGIYPFLTNPPLPPHTPGTNGIDMVNEGLVEAILKRPSSIRPPSTPAMSRMSGSRERSGGRSVASGSGACVQRGSGNSIRSDVVAAGCVLQQRVGVPCESDAVVTSEAPEAEVDHVGATDPNSNLTANECDKPDSKMDPTPESESEEAEVEPIIEFEFPTLFERRVAPAPVPPSVSASVSSSVFVSPLSPSLSSLSRSPFLPEHGYDQEQEQEQERIVNLDGVEIFH